MNDAQVFDQIARAGAPLRVVQLADRLDVDPEEARAKLVSLVAVGDLVETEGPAPNGTQAKFYDFSEQFKASAGYQLIAQKTEAATFEVDPNMSKIDRAIAFVRHKGVATSAELHALLELAPAHTASTWLAAPLKDGRLVKDGKNWTVGIGVKAQGFNRQPISSKKGPVAQFPSSAQPEVPKFLEKRVTVDSKPAGKAAKAPAPVEAPKPADAGDVVTTSSVPVSGDIVEVASAVAEVPEPAPAFRAGLWSDGVLELQRNGVTIEKLSQAEGEQLAEFMQRMRILIAA